MYKKSVLHVQSCFLLLFLLIRPIVVFSPFPLPSPPSIKVMLPETIRKDDFSATQRRNVGTMLKAFEAMSQQCCDAVLR